ncbi:CatB-related O-acetyltransferase [Amedibacillus sp. YH-ame10]
MEVKSYIKYIVQKRVARKQKSKLESRHISKDFKIGRYCIFGEKCYIDRNVTIGDFNYFNANQLEVIIEPNTRIGKFCSIAPGVVIGLGNHNVHSVTTHPILFNPYYSKLLDVEFSGERLGLMDDDVETIIGSDVWIGARATLKRGITVGNGAVIAGEAMVNKDVPAYSIVGGIPAKVMGYRFDKEIIEKLNENEKYTFWNWSEDFFKGHLNELNDINSYLNCIEIYKTFSKG